MKKVYQNYYLENNNLLLMVDLFSSIFPQNSEEKSSADLAVSELGKLELRIAQAGQTGEQIITEDNTKPFFYNTQDNIVGISLSGLLVGLNVLTLRCKYGTNVDVLLTFNLYVPADAGAGLDEQTYNLNVVEQIGDGIGDPSLYATKVELAAAVEETNTELEKKANKDGYYETLTAGMAENLVGQSENTDTFTTETTGGDSDFGNGLAELAKIEGNGLAWNQLRTSYYLSPDFANVGLTASLNANGGLDISGTATSAKTYIGITNDVTYLRGVRKYLIRVTNNTDNLLLGVAGFGINKTTSFIFAPDGTGLWANRVAIKVEEGQVFNTENLCIDIIDLSLIYGLGNEPTSVEQVEADLAKLIAQKPYYQQNAGELYGVKKLHIVSYGQNLLNPTNAQARLAPYDWDTNSNKYGIAFRNGASASAIQFTPDATGVAESITPDSNGIFTISGAGTLQLTVASGSAASDAYVWAVWDGKKDGIESYKPYSADALEIVVGNIYGKLNGAGDMVKVFSDDMMRATGILPTSVRDLVDVASKTAKVNVGSVDLDTAEINKNSRVWYAYTPIAHALSNNGLSNKYSVQMTGVANNVPSGFMNLRENASYIYIGVADDPQPTGDIWYELETPAHYTDLQISTDGGTTFQELPERFSVDNWGVWEQLPNDSTIPSGKDFTGVAAQITTILPMNAPEAIDTFLQQGITTAENRAQVVNILAALKAQNIIGDYSVGETPTDKVFSVSVTPYVEPEPEP